MDELSVWAMLYPWRLLVDVCYSTDSSFTCLHHFFYIQQAVDRVLERGGKSFCRLTIGAPWDSYGSGLAFPSAFFTNSLVIRGDLTGNPRSLKKRLPVPTTSQRLNFGLTPEKSSLYHLIAFFNFATFSYVLWIKDGLYVTWQSVTQWHQHLLLSRSLARKLLLL